MENVKLVKLMTDTVEDLDAIGSKWYFPSTDETLKELIRFWYLYRRDNPKLVFPRREKGEKELIKKF